MDVYNAKAFNVKVVMLKGEKGEKGEGSYDDSELRTLINEERVERGREDGSLSARIDLLAGENTDNATGWSIASSEATAEPVLISGDQYSLTHTFSDVPDDAVVLEGAWSEKSSLAPQTRTDKWKTENTTVARNSILPSTGWDVVVSPITISPAQLSTTYKVKITWAYSHSVDLQELEDCRVGYDGTIYESAGEAIRSQIRALHDLIT